MIEGQNQVPQAVHMLETDVPSPYLRYNKMFKTQNRAEDKVAPVI